MGGCDVPDLQAVVTERGQDIYFAYAIPACSSDPYAPPLFWLLPGLVSQNAIRRISVVPCGRGENCPSRPDLECHETPADVFIPDVSLNTEALSCHVSGRSQTSLEQLICLQLQVCNKYEYQTLYIRRHECLPCCVKVMLRDSDKLRRQFRMTRERWEDTKIVFHVMNTEECTHYDPVPTGLHTAALPPTSG